MNKMYSLIPQRPPFMMVSDVVQQNGNNVACLRIEEGLLFVSDGLFQEAGLVEHMAQSTAALSNYAQQQENGSQPAKVGFIGAIQNLQVRMLPPVASTITTTIEVQHEVLNAQIVKATTWLNDAEVATCVLKIFTQS